MILKENAQRACIYFIYDRDGIIDDYVVFQLRELRKNVSFLHCVINGELTEQGKRDLEALSDEVYVRENKGNDVGAYKAAISYIGWEKLSRYDELVLMNNTCFGPVYPFKEVFDWADKQDLDFWGLTWGERISWTGTDDYLHHNDSKYHIQSYFLVIRKPLLGSELLKNFFDEIPEDTSYILSGSYYEYAFPGYFEERGYKGGVYCDDKEDMNYPLLHNPIHLVRDYRMPLFKKRSFSHHYTDVLNNTEGEATVRLMRYLEENTDYDMNLVWSSILRTNSLSDIVRCAQLNRVLPRDYVLPGRSPSALKVGVIFHAYYPDLFDENIAYIRNFPDDTGILITTNTEEKKAQLEEKLKKAGRTGKVIVICNRGRDVSSLLVGGAEFVTQYDLICFSHDKKTSQVLPSSVGRSWAYKINENIYPTKEYVLNVIDLFTREPRLGIAFPSYPNHSGYANNIGTGWSGNYKNTKSILDAFGVKVKTNEHTLCVAPLGTCFWFRAEAMKKLFRGLNGNGWSYEDFPREPNKTDQTVLHAIERAYAYFVQDAGFYPCFLYSDKNVQIELTNLEFNKSGSTEMRAWVDALALSAIGYRDLDESLVNQMTSEEVMMRYNQNINYGIRGSLTHLGHALGVKFPLLWKCFKPARVFIKWILRVK